MAERTSPGEDAAALIGTESDTLSWTKAQDNAVEKRKAIQAIMKDTTLTELERRLRIQRLMDGSSAAIDAHGKSEKGEGINLLSVGLENLNTTGTEGLISEGGRESGDLIACVHYQRKCNVVAPCCGVPFGCRVCHDEMSTACGPMDRFSIKEIVCKDCGTRQSGSTNVCMSCGITFAEWHCAKCNLWMNLSKRPFHCDKCGICRVGGRDKFQHCEQCCMCISVSVFDTHNCIKDKYKTNCPVCHEDMFSSRQPPQELPCGHAIHSHCFRNLAGFDYRCPICKKTVVDKTSMAAAWHARARDIEMQPMPEDLARIVNIICNDCEKKSKNCNWHFLGVRCECGSFNTVVEQIVSGASASN